MVFKWSSPYINLKIQHKVCKDNELAKLHVQLVGAFSGQKVDITSATKDKKKLL